MKTKSIIMDLILILCSFGLWNIWMQYRQIRDVNTFSEKKYSFLFWMIASVCTFGLYHIYHEYKLTKEIARKKIDSNSEILGIMAAVLSTTGLWIIVDLFQQDMLNDITMK